jgi:hypothetical protein
MMRDHGWGNETMRKGAENDSEEPQPYGARRPRARAWRTVLINQELWCKKTMCEGVRDGSQEPERCWYNKTTGGCVANGSKELRRSGITKPQVKVKQFSRTMEGLV